MATWPAHRELQYIIGVEERCDQRGTGSLERTSVNDRNGSRLCENARAPFSCVNFSHVDAISGDFSHRIRPLAILRGERKVFSHGLDPLATLRSPDSGHSKATERTVQSRADPVPRRHRNAFSAYRWQWPPAGKRTG